MSGPLIPCGKVPGADAPVFAEACGRLLGSLGLAVKLTALYRSAHPTAAQAVRDAFALLTAALRVSSRGAISLGRAEQGWLCEGIPVPAGPGCEPLGALFAAHDIGVLNFARGTRCFELAALCELAAAPARAENRQSLEDFFAQRGIRNISCEAAGYVRAHGRPQAPLPPARPGPQARNFSSALKALVESAATDPDERAHLYADTVALVDEAMEQHIARATAALEVERDLALRERSRTQTVLSSVAEGQVIVDHEGKVLMMNPAAEEMAGRPLRELAGRHIAESVKPGEQMVAMVQDGERASGRSAEINITAEDDVSRTMRRSMAIVQDDSGRVVGAYAALPEATKYKQVLQMQEEFLSRVTHDLQAPLASICCSLELIQERIGPKLCQEEASFIAIGLRNSRQLGAMIREILDFSKLKAGKLTIRPEPTSAAEMLAEAVESMQPWARNKEIALRCRKPDARLLVRADRRRIIQVLDNLISNAIKFTPQGGRITVGAGVKSTDPGVVLFGVRDTGCGIPQESLGQVFEKFAQPAGPETQGTGLGLAIVREFVKLHGGRVGVASKPGKGATFFFTLPAQSPESR
jgi:PAS domain S-box-containing protein